MKIVSITFSYLFTGAANIDGKFNLELLKNFPFEEGHTVNAAFATYMSKNQTIWIRNRHSKN